MTPTGIAAIHVEPGLPRDASAAFLGLPPSPGAVALVFAAAALIAVRLARLSGAGAVSAPRPEPKLQH